MGIPYFEIAEDSYKIEFLGGPMVTYAWIRKNWKNPFPPSELDFGVINYKYRRGVIDNAIGDQMDSFLSANNSKKLRYTVGYISINYEVNSRAIIFN